MANVFDVAAYILEKAGPMTTWKLQKLVYYSQAWSIVWDEDELFPEEIRAWANGPVVRELYNVHQGKFRIDKISCGDPNKLTEVQRETVDAVLKFYSNRSGQWLSELTHLEDPWRDARQDIPDTKRGDKIISKESLGEYYGSL